MLKNIINLKLLLLLILLCFSLTGYSTKVQVMTDSLKLNNTIDSLKIKISSLEKDVLTLQKEKIPIDIEREVWSQFFSRSIAIYSSIISVLIFIGGFWSYKKASGTLEEMKKYMDTKTRNLTERNLRNESLIFRNMFFTNNKPEYIQVAILWASRVLLKEGEKSQMQIYDSNIFKVFADNILKNLDELSNISPGELKIYLETHNNFEMLIKDYSQSIPKEDMNKVHTILIKLNDLLESNITK